MGNKKRKNKKKNKKKIYKKKKNVTKNDFKSSLSLNDIFILDEIYLKDSKKIINMEIDNYIISSIKIENKDIDSILHEEKKENYDINYSDLGKLLLDDLCRYNSEENTNFLENEEINSLEIYKEILQELDKYKKNKMKISKCFLNIPLNNWGEWIYN